MISKEKVFLYKVDSMYKTINVFTQPAEKRTSDSNEFLFAGVFAHLCPLEFWGLDTLGGVQSLRDSPARAGILSFTHTGCKNSLTFLGLTFTVCKVGCDRLVTSQWGLNGFQHHSQHVITTQTLGAIGITHN